MTKKKKKSRIYIIWLMNLCLITTVVAIFVWYESVPDVSPEKVLKTYMAHISNREYEQMYEMIDAGISGNISQEDFVRRNSAIYEGIDVDNMKVHITSYDKEQKEICYETVSYTHLDVYKRQVQNAKRNMGGILGARRVGGQWYNFIKKKQPPEPAS